MNSLLSTSKPQLSLMQDFTCIVSRAAGSRLSAVNETPPGPIKQRGVAQQGSAAAVRQAK
jgi:hypothetical protein